MRKAIGMIITSALLASCAATVQQNPTDKSTLPIEGTWKLLSGTTIEKGDTTTTYYDKNLSFIKIINDTHFAFLNHDIHQGKDSATAAYSSGGGSYTLQDSTYTEHLEYCSDRQWEGNDFKFTIRIKNDTLIQTGIEKVESAGVDRLNIEKYVRLK
jgi:predicted small secreted protein